MWKFSIMVTIINGEIVPDNDPRAKAYRERKSNTNRQESTSRTANENARTNGRGTQYGRQDNVNNNNQASPFTEINNYLLRVGIPRFTLAGTVVEPIILIAALLVLVFFGLPGLILMAIAYFVFSSGLGNSGVNQRQGRMWWSELWYLIERLQC